MKKLEDLLALENPTLDDLEESQQLLLETRRSTEAEIRDLEEEDRARASDRLQNKDDGGAERAAAKAKAEKRIDDANFVLHHVQSRIAAIKAQNEQEIEQAAWAQVREQLAIRRKAIERIEELSKELAKEHSTALNAWQTAFKAAPGPLKMRDFADVAGVHPITVGMAVMARVNIDIGLPLRADELHFYQNAMRFGGLVGYIEQSERVILERAR